MIYKTNYKNNCWWCGAKADSREHRYKKTDLIREFGGGSYLGDKSILRYFSDESQMISVQGPNSSQVKFKKSICHHCNTTKSKPFDEAYDKFNIYLKENEEKIFEGRKFYFSNIFFDDWQIQRENLIKYYLKHLCSRLAETGIGILPEIILYLNGLDKLKYVSFHLFLRGDIMYLINKMKTSGTSGYLHLGSLEGTFSEENDAFNFLTGTLDYRAFSLKYFYSLNIENSVTNFENDLVIPDYYESQEAIEFIKKNYKND